MASSPKEAQNENETQNDAENTLSDRQDGTNHSRSSSAISLPAWRVVFLSSKVRHSTVLNSAARSSVLFVPYKYDSSTLESLLTQAQHILAGRKAESIAFMAHGQGSNMFICANDDQVTRNDTIFLIIFKNQLFKNHVKHELFSVEIFILYLLELKNVNPSPKED